MKCCAVRTSPLQFPLRIKALNVGGRRSLGLMGESKHGTLTSSIGIRVLFPLLNLSELKAEGRKVLAAFYHREDKQSWHFPSLLATCTATTVYNLCLSARQP